MKEKFLYRCISLVPEDFDTIPAKKFIELTDIIFSNREELTKKTIAITLFLGWRTAWFKDYELIEFTKTVDWMFEPELKCEKTIIPFIRIGNKKYSGPERQLYNTDWGPFHNASDYLTIFEESNSLKHLDKAIALLYPSDDFYIHSERISKMPMPVKLAIYWNWILMINYLATIFPYVFKKSTKKQEEKNKKIHLWYHTMNEWLDYKVEDFAKKDNMPTMEILSSLNLQIKNFKEQKNKTKK
jgi:hypothetical protein